MSSHGEVADFTTGNSHPIVCQRCLQSFEDGTELYFMHDRKSDRGGKRICAGCRQYYFRKTEARSELASGSSRASASVQITPVAQPIVSRQDIQKAVAQAQRRGQNHPGRMGQQLGLMPPPPVPSSLRHHDTQRSIISRDTWPKASGSKHTSTRPHFHGHSVSIRPIIVPKFVSDPSMPVQPGYQEAHKIYDEMRQFFAQKAMSVHNGEVVVIKVTMMSLKPGNKNPSVVSNISETISNIPVYIGVRELKRITYFTLLPPFMKWSKDYTLAIEDLRLRFKDWVELIPAGPDNEDVRAISSKFFLPKGKSKTIQFHPNKVLELYLELAYDKYAEIQNRLEDIEDQSMPLPNQQVQKMSISYLTETSDEGEDDYYQLFRRSQSLSPPNAFAARKRLRKRQLSKASITSPPRAKPRLNPVTDAAELPTMLSVEFEDPGSPSASDVRRALEAQTAPSKKKMRSILSTLSVQCTLYPTAATTFSSLISQARPFDAIKDCEGPTALTLIYNPNATPKYGGFKRALFGHLGRPVISGSTSICIKQCWYLCKASGTRLVYDNLTQIAKLSAEINCLRWASALMGIVYDFVDKHNKTHGEPSFMIPKMRFVKNALAIVDTTHETYMVEEVIDEAVHGTFMKYIGNGSVKPYEFLDDAAAYRAEFLVFSQHVQYLKTKGLAFIGDFQGGTCLLTDPQIITASDTGLIFSDGNLSSTHATFATQHICNMFCKFFKLPMFSTQTAGEPLFTNDACSIAPQEEGEITEVSD